MDRLTIPDEPIEGGMRRTVIDAREVRKSAMTIYWRLKAYEDTGLTPGEIMDGRMPTGWIPVTERLPSTSGRFEVTIRGSKGKRYVEMCDFQKEAFPDWRWGGRYGTKNVIAWRARPIPYKDK